MSDVANGNSANGKADAAPGPQMQNGVPGQLTINLQYVKDLSFENPNAPQSMINKAEAPSVEVQVNVGARGLGPETYEVLLNVTANAKHGDDPAFLVEVAYAGVFTLQGVPAEHVHPILFIECPRLLFPFARAVLADATRDGGFPPLMIQPIDFVELYRRQAAAQAQTAESATV